MSFSVGDLVGTIALDDRAFRAGVARTQAGIKSLDGSLGKFSQGLTRTTSQGVGKLGEQFNIVHQNFDKVSNAAPKMAAGMARVQNALTGLTIAGSGANPHLAKLSILMTGLAMGGPAVTGILLAGAAVATVWSKMKEDSDIVSGAIEEQIKKFKELARVQAFGAKAPHLTSIANAQASQQFLREKIQERGIDMAKDATRFGVGGQLSGVVANDPKLREWITQFNDLGAGIELSRAEIAKIDAELGKNAADAAEDIAELDTRLNLLKATLPELVAEVNRMMATRFGMGAAGNASVASGIEAGLSAQDAATVGRQNLSRALGRISPNLSATVRNGAGGGALDNAVGKFKDAVDSFGDGVKGMIKGTVKGAFSAEGLANIGANLASGGISAIASFAAGKLIDGISGLFNKVDEGQKRLADAMERNTMALTASSAFLKGRVDGAGLGSFASEVARVVGGLLDRLAVGEFKSSDLKRFGRSWLIDMLDGIFGEGAFGDTAAVAGLLEKLASALGLDLDNMDEDTFRQLLEALTKAGFGLDSLAESARETSEALRNVPEGFKIAQAIFDATEGASVAGLAGAGPAGIVVNQNAPVYIDANSKPIGQAYDEWAGEDARRSVRGGASSYRGRGPL